MGQTCIWVSINLMAHKGKDMKAISAYSSDEMREIAREYASQWSTDESSADVDKYDFTFEKYDLTNLKVDLRKFLESEYKLWLRSFGEEEADERLMYFMEEYPFDEQSQKNDPIIVIEKNGKGYVWDGTHRTSGLLENNIFDAWAIVGRPKEDLSGSGSRGGSKLNLKQCLEIKENQYRSRDARYDYQPEEIEERILELQANKDERHLKLLEKQMEEWPEDVPWPATAGLSPVLYHYTNVPRALEILQDKKFHLSPAIGTNSDMAPNYKLYYLSCSRIKFGGYSRAQTGNSGVHFVLDGVKLAQKYAGSPMDYWGDEWRNALLKDAKTKNLKIDELFEDYLGKDENEDRVFSDEPTIPIDKYVTEVHVYLKPNASRDFYSMDYQRIMSIARLCMSYGFDVYLYDDLAAFKSQVKSKSKPFSELTKPEKKEEIKYRSRYGNVDYWDYIHQIYHSRNLKDLSKYAYNNAWDLQSEYRKKEIASRIKTDIHNTRHGSKESKEELAKLLKLFKENNCKTVEEFIDVLADKAKALIEKENSTAADTQDWPPEWLGYGVTEKDLAFLYAVADNFTGFLTEEMMEEYEGVVYRKSEHDDENHDSFWTADISVADKFDGKLRKMEYKGKAWPVSKYLKENHQRLAKIKHELGGDSKMWELEELVATGLAYNSTEPGSIVIPDGNVDKKNIQIVTT